MAGYQRMVSYLYEYNQGEKGANVGYAKLEIREDIAKMIVSIRLRKDTTNNCPVGFYYREGRQAYRIPVGEVRLNGGRVQERILLPGAKAGESGLLITQMSGLLISLPNGVIGSAWDEQDVPVDAPTRTGVIQPKISKLENTQSETEELYAAEVSLPDSEEQKEESENQLSDLPERNDWGREPERWRDGQEGDRTWREREEQKYDTTEVPITEPRWDTRRPDAGKPIQESNVRWSESEEMITQEPEAKWFRREETVQKSEQEKEQRRTKGAMSQEPGIEYPVEYFFRQGTRMCPFEDEAITDCVRIEPADLEYFPKETWILGSNSYLLHGYYTYGHLILAKMKGMGRESIIIGVPGLYQNRERFLAKMFGFEYFKPIGKAGAEEGDFGYWYLFLPDSIE